jgi:hypothetical protein
VSLLQPHSVSSSIQAQYDKIKPMREFGFDRDAADYRNAMTFQRDRPPCASKCGHVALAPAYAEPGDCVCNIFGSPVLFIPRASTEGKSVLIGEAYIYSIMDNWGGLYLQHHGQRMAGSQSSSFSNVHTLRQSKQIFQSGYSLLLDSN